MKRKNTPDVEVGTTGWQLELALALDGSEVRPDPPLGVTLWPEGSVLEVTKVDMGAEFGVTVLKGEPVLVVRVMVTVEVVVTPSVGRYREHAEAVVVVSDAVTLHPVVT